MSHRLSRGEAELRLGSRHNDNRSVRPRDRSARLTEVNSGESSLVTQALDGSGTKPVLADIRVHADARICVVGMASLYGFLGASIEWSMTHSAFADVGQARR